VTARAEALRMFRRQDRGARSRDSRKQMKSILDYVDIGQKERRDTGGISAIAVIGISPACSRM
jgi:hypothetical protein